MAKQNSNDGQQHPEYFLLEQEKIKTRRQRNKYIFFGVITREKATGWNVADYVDQSVNALLAYGYIDQYPYVSYAEDGKADLS